MQRFDLDSAVQHLNLAREMSVLRPLNQVVGAYWEFFQAGHSLLGPLQKKMDDLSIYVKQKEDLLSKELGSLRETRRQWEKKTGAQSKDEKTAQLAVAGASSSTGIRDLDGSRGKPVTNDREKEGYIFTPAPNFALVWASLKDTKLTVQRPGILVAIVLLVLNVCAVKLCLGAPDMSVPVQLCTVKENRELKMRFVFSVISPSETILLQCDRSYTYAHAHA